MGRLIDESDVIKAIDRHTKDCSEVVLDNDISCILEEVPTAYDTEKVVEQLNDLLTFKVSATSEKHPFSAYEAEMISKHKVMGIVKKGGAE